MAPSLLDFAQFARTIYAARTTIEWHSDVSYRLPWDTEKTAMRVLTQRAGNGTERSYRRLTSEKAEQHEFNAYPGESQ